MSEQIPNLNTLRQVGTCGKGRGIPAVKSKDEIIQSTDCDASASRVSAVEAGYLDDDFARLITVANVQRRLPLMNRGTYVRTSGIDQIVNTFIKTTSGRRQIISLGAGSDTRYFRLKQKQPTLDLLYHEVDFLANNKTKIDRLRSSEFKQAVKEFADLENIEIIEGNLVSKDYRLHALDLRELPEDLTWIDKSLPTLLISECCLIYLSPDEADKTLAILGSQFKSTPLAIAIYEPIHPNDAFGRTMVRNLVSRGIYLQTLEKYADLDKQCDRLVQCGYVARSADIQFIWKNWIHEAEKDRVESLEWMDEIEEFVLLAKHYCISWGWKNWEDDNGWEALATTG